MNARLRSWLLPPCAAALLFGILIGRETRSLLWPLAALAVCIPALFLLRNRLRFLACLLLSVSVGAAAGQAAFHPVLPPEGDYDVTGIITGEITSGRLSQVRVPLSAVSLNGRPYSSGAYWTFYTDEIPPELLPGREVLFRASLYHPSGAVNPDGYDFQEALLRKGMTIGLYGSEGLAVREPAVFSLRGTLASLRHRLSRSLVEALGGESGGYAAALLLGFSDMVPSADREAFSNLGIAHILSVSGFHVGVIIGVLALLFRLLKLRQKVRLVLYAVILFLYAFLCGLNPPVIRAALLTLLSVEGRILQRPRSGIHLLSAAVAVTALVSPVQVTGASFQLTYAAMFGLVWFTPLVSRIAGARQTLPAKLLRAVLMTFGIQLAILYPELLHFQRFPLWGFLFNVPAVTVFTFLILLYWIALLLLPFGLTGLLAAPLSFLTGKLLSLIRSLGSVPGQTLWIHMPNLITALGVLLMLVGLGFIFRFTRLQRAVLSVLGAAAVAVSLLSVPYSGTEYMLFSAGNADAAILRDEDRLIVLDTGEPGSPLSGYLRAHRLTPDAVILSHLHIDHAGGLDDMIRDRIPIPVLYLPEGAQEQQVHPDISSLLDQLRAGGTEIRTLTKGDVLPLPSGTAAVLWPERGKVRPGQDANNYSLVTRFLLHGASMLQTGDLTGSYEHYAASSSDILKAAHHGSSGSTGAAFLESVQPKTILVSCDRAERAEQLRGRAGGVPVWSTAESGALTIRFEETGYTVIPFLKGDD